MAAPPPLATFDVASASAPTNIAVVKYWGKDAARGGNTPINSSASLTLDPNDLRAETVMVASPELRSDELYLNGRKVDVKGDGTHAKRLRRCLATMRRRCAKAKHPPRSSRATSSEELSRWGVRVVSRNTFPTAAGLASSAAGYAALVRCASELYGVRDTPSFSLSATAREGSGSACRSLDGGLVAWRKGCRADRADSKAEQLFDEIRPAGFGREMDGASDAVGVVGREMRVHAEGFAEKRLRRPLAEVDAGPDAPALLQVPALPQAHRGERAVLGRRRRPPRGAARGPRRRVLPRPRGTRRVVELSLIHI